MKNLKNLGLALALLLSVSLAGCKFNKSSSSASSEPEISEPGTSEGGSSEGGSSEGGSSSEEPAVTYTCESVATDILGEALVLEGDEANCEYYDSTAQEGYSLFRGYLLNPDTYTEEQILPYTTQEELPDYLELEEDWGVQTWLNNGTVNGYFIDYKTPDETVYVCVYGYFVEDYAHPTYGTVDVFGVGIDVITSTQYEAQFAA